MAHKFNGEFFMYQLVLKDICPTVPVCPHAGGVGLCEYVQHLAIWDYISVSGSLKNRMAEFVTHLHEHFKYPAQIVNGKYVVPKDPGYCGQMLESSMREYEFPDGTYWKSKNLK